MPRDRGDVTFQLIFLILAIVLFVILGAVGAGWITMEKSAALLGFGLACFAVAHVP